MTMMVHDNKSRPAEPDRAAAVDLGGLSGMIGFALRRAQAAVAQDFQGRFGAEDIRSTQYAVLEILRRNPGLRQNRVSEALGIKRTNFVPILDELARRGLAERRRVPGDRRVAALFLTDAGNAMLQRLADSVQAHEDRFTARIGAANRDTLLGLLARLSDPALEGPA